MYKRKYDRYEAEREQIYHRIARLEGREPYRWMTDGGVRALRSAPTHGTDRQRAEAAPLPPRLTPEQQIQQAQQRRQEVERLVQEAARQVQGAEQQVQEAERRMEGAERKRAPKTVRPTK